MCIRQSQSRRAFTLMEVAMIILGLALAWIFLRPSLFRPRAKAERIYCVSNLKQVGLAFRMWSNDNSDQFPWLLSTNAVGTNYPGTLELIPLMAPEVHFRAISNELGSVKILRCKEDEKRSWATNWNSFTRTNLSYFVNLDANEANPQSVLIGDRNLMVNSNGLNPGQAIITPKQTLGWGKDLHNQCGNIGLSDGSVQQVSETDLNKQFQASSLPTNRLVIP